MKAPSFLVSSALFAATLAIISPASVRADVSALVDDFSSADHSPSGVGRLVIDDKGAGSQSHATLLCENGVLKVEGELVPGRGAPAFISLPLVLGSDGKPQDISKYTGVRLRVKLGQGPLSVQVSSTDVQNFDYHAAVVIAKRGEFVEVKLPFTELKRAWSEQTPLNTKTVTSVNLVAFAMAKTAFAFEVDEIGFY